MAVTYCAHAFDAILIERQFFKTSTKLILKITQISLNYSNNYLFTEIIGKFIQFVEQQ